MPVRSIRAFVTAVAVLGLWAIVPPTAASASPAALAEVRRELAADCASGRFSGSAVVRQRGRMLLELHCGQADRAAAIPIRRATRFKLASVTKPLTAIAILRLVEQRRLGLDDPVTRYLPDAPTAWSAVSVRHLLQHRSGIADQMEAIEKQYSGDHPAAVRAVIRELALARHRPTNPPGTGYDYSNFNYELLGLVVSQVTRMPLDKAMANLIFVPAGMRTAGLEASPAVRDSLRRRDRAQALARAYMPEGMIDEEFAHLYLASGSAYATVADLLALDQALAGTRLLSPASKSRLVAEAIEIRPGYRQALAGLLRHQGGELVWYQWGAMDGFKPFFGRVPSRGIAVVVLSNWNDVKPDQVGTKLLDAALAK